MNSPSPQSLSLLDRRFRLTERGTDVRTEVIGGITTFLTMVYALAVTPAMLADAGMDATAVLLASALASGLATILMGLLANLPFALSTGMGLNAFFAYTVVIAHGYPWQLALLCVFIEGIIFIILSLCRVREMIFDVIPVSLKLAISAGIGAFLIFIGLQNAGIVIDNGSTLVGLVNFRIDFHTAGISALLAIIGTFAIFVLHANGSRLAILYGILGTWLLGIICQLTGIYVPDPATGFYSVYPAFRATDFRTLGLTAGQCFMFLGAAGGFAGINLFEFFTTTLTFLYTDMFDTIGTLIGGATRGKMLDKDGKLPEAREALLADAVGTAAGAALGTSTITTFVESSAGIEAGARTGLASIVTGVLFLVSTFAASLFTSIPSFATAPALIYVGTLMFTSVAKIDFSEEKAFTDFVPAVLCIISMLLFYSIAEGISVGIISYVLLHVFAGQKDRVSPLMYVLCLIFFLKYLFI